MTHDLPSLPLLKRARSVKDAYPPSGPRTPTKTRRHRLKAALGRDRDHRDRECVRTLSLLDFHQASALLLVLDSELLPDLTDDASSICSTPQTPSASFVFGGFLSSPPKLLPQPKLHRIFEIPELVFKIVEYADYASSRDLADPVPIRRKPLSFEHALLLHGNETTAKLAMAQEIPQPASQSKAGSILRSCLLVNKLFYDVTRQLMGRHLVFKSQSSLYGFLSNGRAEYYRDFKPEKLVISKLYSAKQPASNRLAQLVDCSSLIWLELFMCPKLLPTISQLHSRLQTLIIPGSKVLDDLFMVQVAHKCPSLQVLDIRACENVTDCGIYALAKSCSQLTSVNFGRKSKGHLVTDHSLAPLFRHNPRLSTVGLAGCHVSDHSLWELAATCGHSLKRLSLNNCPGITNHSLPLILHNDMLKQLSVLEVRFLIRLTNIMPLVTFKRRQMSRGICVLIETCEVTLARIKQCESEIDAVFPPAIIRDIFEYVNTKDDDGDALHHDLILARASSSYSLASL